MATTLYEATVARFTQTLDATTKADSARRVVDVVHVSRSSHGGMMFECMSLCDLIASKRS